MGKNMNHHHHNHSNHSHNCEDEVKVGEEQGENLYDSIDLDKIWCLNELERGMGRLPFKPADKRLDISSYLISNEDDPQLILHVPFICQVKMKSFCIIGHSNGFAPNILKIFVNREDIDFTNVEEINETQKFMLSEDLFGAIYYPVKPSKFFNVHSLTLFIDNTESETEQTRINYIEFKGQSTKNKRVRAVNVVYESQANPADHKLKDEFQQTFNVS